MECWYKGKCNLENKDCEKSCLRFRSMSYLISTSNLPVELQYPRILEPDLIDVKTFNILHQIKRDINELVKNGECIYIHSKTCGNGKTTWSTRLLLAYFNEIWAYSHLKSKGIYLYAPSFLTSVKTQFLNDLPINELIEDAKKCDLLVLDDIGVGKLTDFDVNNLLTIIDYRINNRKSIIFTSNLSKEELSTTFGNRLTSRVYSNSTVIALKGRDRRGEQ